MEKQTIDKNSFSTIIKLAFLSDNVLDITSNDILQMLKKEIKEHINVKFIHIVRSIETVRKDYTELDDNRLLLD